MSPATFATAMALLAVIAVGAAAAAVVGRLGGRESWVPDGRTALVWALGIATVATLGSLTFSEVFHFTPCRLCWWQRYAMYPLVPILAVAAWWDALALRRVVIPVGLVGAGISTWHVLVQRVPSLSGTASCDATAPCSGVWVEALGVFTIPTMALAGFVAIVALLATARPVPSSTPS